MALRLIFILIFTLSSALAAPLDFSEIYPSVNMCMEEDPLSECAADLCGPPNQHQSASLQDYNFERYVSPEGIAAMPKVKAELEKLLLQKISESKKLIEELKKKKADGSLIPQFDSLTAEEWDQYAISIYQTHLGFNPYMDDVPKSKPEVSSKVLKGLQAFAKGEATCATAACREGVKDYLVEDLYGRKLEELSVKISNPNLLKDRLPLCLSSFAETSLKKNQHQKIQKELPRIYEEFIAKALNGYSDHSKNVFREFLKNDLEIKFDEPQRTPEEYRDEMKAVGGRSKIGKTTLDLMLSYRLGKKTMDPLADLGSLCPGSFARVNGDVFFPTSGDPDSESQKSALIISLASQMDPASGEGVIFHELGHALSHVFGLGKMSPSSTAEFKKLRNCAKSLSPQDPATPNNIVASHAGDHECTEEDTADLISYKTQGTKAGPLSECSLLKQTADKTEYEKLEMNSKNSHSAKLVRILREAVHRDRTIPASCQKVMNQYKTQYVFKKCF